MKKLNSTLLLSLLIFLLVGCSKEDTQPLNSNDDVTLKKGNANHFVPFNASFEVNVDSVLPSPPPPKIQEVLGTGNATHLGKTDIYIKQWWWPDSPPPFFPPWYGHGNGEIVFTAANGDILLADYDDAIGYHETYTNVEITFTGHFKNGGTGRFVNAEGSFIWDGIYNPVINEGSSTCTGQIKYSK